jgi:signal transduction histidine kinase
MICPPDQLLDGRFCVRGELQRRHGVATYLGHDLALDRPVAIKSLTVEHLTSGARYRLEHEAEVLRSVSSSYLVPLLHLGELEGQLYLVTPWIEGQTLETRLRSGVLTPRETIAIAGCLFTALQAAHEAGVLHRDIKPANLVVSESAAGLRATLIDFGLSRSERLHASLREVPVGTLHYISPEQAGLLREAVDERSDLYSAGALLFECLAGRPPFSSDRGLSELLRQHASVPAPRLRQLGVTLPGALDELVQRLLHKQPRERYQTAAAVAQDVTVIAEALDRGEAEPELVLGLWDRGRGLTEPAFVGRRQELARLEETLAATRRGSAALVLVEGESGSGKSRLLNEFALHGAATGALVLRGQASDQGGRPCAVLDGVTRELVTRALGDDDLATTLRDRLQPHRQDVCRALPELGALLGAPPAVSPGPEEHGATRTAAGLSAFFDALGSASAPALVLLDDAQWIDELTLQAIARWRPWQHVLLVLAFRSEEVGQDHPLRSLPRAAALELRPFGNEDTRRLLESMAGPLPPQVLDVGTLLAEGNPFWAVAVLWGLVESGALVGGPEGWRVVPEALVHAQASHRAATLLGRGFARLPADVLRLLSAAAVLGRTFQLDDLFTVSGSPPARAFAALQLARRRHLLWSDDVRGRWRLIHDRLRDDLLGRLTTMERIALHRRAAEHLEATRPDRTFEVAHHFDAAGEADRALPFALAAAASARAAHSWAIAEEQYRIAERGATSAPARMRLRVAEGLGDVLTLRDQHAEARRQLLLAGALAADDVTRARLQGKLARVAFRQGDTRTLEQAALEGLRLLGREVPRSSAAIARGVLLNTVRELAARQPHRPARALSEGVSDLLAVELLTLLCRAWWFDAGALPAAWALLQRLTIARRYPPTAELAMAYVDAAPLLGALSLFDRAVSYARQSHAIYAARNDLWGQGMALHHEGLVLYGAGRWSAAMERLAAAARMLESEGDLWETASARAHLGYAHLRLGALRQAAAIGREVHGLGRRCGLDLPLVGGLSLWAYASGGDVPEEAVSEAVGRTGKDVVRLCLALLAEALRLLRAGRPLAAADLLERGWDAARRRRVMVDHVYSALAWLVTAQRLAAVAAPPDQARSRLGRARAVARRLLLVARRFPNHQAHALREAGLLAASSGDTRRCRRLLHASLEAARRLGARHEEAQTLLAIGRIGQTCWWPGAALDEQRALRLLVELGSDFALGQRIAPAAPPTLSHADRYEQLLDAGRRIVTGLSRDAVLDAVHQAALSLLRAERCAILGTGDAATLPIVAGAIDSPPSRSLVERARTARRPVLAAFGAAEASDSLVITETRSALAAPIIQRDDVHLCLYASGRIGGLFGDEEDRLASFVTTLAGAALENAASYADLATTLAELRATQAQLIQAGKLAALGELGAGLAHELAQPVSTVQGFAQRILRHSQAPIAAHADELQMIVSASQRMARIIDNIRLFSRDRAPQLEPLDPLTPLEDALLLLGRQLESHDIVVQWSERPADLPRVRGDRVQLQQVFLNLLVNARDALDSLPVGRPRRIRLDVRRQGSRLLLSVCDNGPGVASTNEGRIFDPFFTTKHATQGTGLGLSISYGILKSHRGELRYCRASEQGACFTVELPADDETS